MTDPKGEITLFLKSRLDEAEQRQKAIEAKFAEKAAPLLVGPQSSTLLWEVDDAHPEIFKFSILDKDEQAIVRSILDEAVEAYNTTSVARKVLELWLGDGEKCPAN